MCSGDAHGLSERRAMPLSSILRNSSFAYKSLLKGNLREPAGNGSPLVVIRCITLCLGVAHWSWGVMMFRKSVINLAYSLLETVTEQRWDVNPFAWHKLRDSNVSELTRRCLFMSTSKGCVWRSRSQAVAERCRRW